MENTRTQEEWVIDQAAQEGFFEHCSPMIVAIYFLLGPPIGGLLTAFSTFGDFKYRFSLATFLHSPVEFLWDFLQFSFAAAIAGYIFGGMQALACGAILLAASDKNGRFTYLQAAFAASIVAAVVVSVFLLSNSDLISAVFVGGAGLPTAIILRFLFRRRFAPIKPET